MPRFFTAGSDSETDTSSSDGEIETRPIVSTRNFQWSDDEEDTKRVVKSAKTKRFEELKSVIKKIRNHRKNKDMAHLQTDFDELSKVFEKSKRIVEEEGRPKFFIRCLAELDDFINQHWDLPDLKKTLSKNNMRGLTVVRQKLKKYLRDMELVDDVQKYKENPDTENVFKSDTEEEEEVEEVEQPNYLLKGHISQPKAPFLKTVAKEVDEGDSSDDSIDWGSSDSDSSSDDDDYSGNLAAKFLKKTTEEKAKEKEKEKDRLKEERKQKLDKRAERKKQEEQEGWTKVQGGTTAQKTEVRLFSKDQEVTVKAMTKKIADVLAAHGKKKTKGSDQIRTMMELRRIAQDNKLGAAMDVKLLMLILSCLFDSNTNIITAMKVGTWKNVVNYLEILIEILNKNPNIVIGLHVAEDSECFEEDKARISGCILSKIEKMDNEFVKILQNSDAHSTEYVNRLKSEVTICKVITDFQYYLEKSNAPPDEMCRIMIRRLEHIYYKYDSAVQCQLEEPKKSEALKERDVVDNLCRYIYVKDNTDRIRTRAILCQIYYYALHDYWYDARNLMLMSHLQDVIQHSDVATQILYNRCMSQLGLCAFRQGLIKDAHHALVDIQSVGRAKELLAQGLLLQRQYERTAEQEKMEKRRQIPYHMHINLELLECTYLVSAMLIEIPYMAAHEMDARRRMISKNFHHVLRVIDRQPLVGPPESMREHVVAASKAMKNGKWELCKDYLLNEKMDSKVWNLFRDSEKIKAMVSRKIQEASLHTYLFTYSGIYDSISLKSLAEMFDLELPAVHSAISKMIINEELMASLDEPTQSVVMHRTEPSPLHSLSLQLSEKIGVLVENNERMLEVKSTGAFYIPSKGGDYRNQRDGRNRQNDKGDGKRGGYNNRENYGRREGKDSYGGRRDHRDGGYNDRRGGRKNYGYNDKAGRSSQKY